MPEGATAVAVNITAVDPIQGGYVTVWPCGEPMPTASNVNYQAGETTPNLVIVKLGTNGKVCVFSEQTTGILADVAGYFGVTSPFVALTPTRILETRPAAGQVNYSGDKPAAGAVVRLPVAGANGVPADAAGVVVNITGVDPSADGYLTVWPCGAPMPTASNLNLSTGANRANLVISKLGDGGAVCIFAEQGADLIADLAGYFPAGSNYTALNPERVLETRPGAGLIGYTGDQPAAGATVAVQVTGIGRSLVPATASAVVLNITGTAASADGYVTVWPCGQDMPTVSNLNLRAGQTAPNLVIVKPGTDGKVCVFTEAGTHLLADLAGYFPAE